MLKKKSCRTSADFFKNISAKIRRIINKIYATETESKKYENVGLKHAKNMFVKCHEKIITMFEKKII